MAKDLGAKTIYAVTYRKNALAVYLFIGGLIVVSFNSKIGLTGGTIHKWRDKKAIEIQLSLNDKIYQTAIKLLGPEWFYAMKYYTTEAIATDTDLQSLVERDQSFRNAWGEYSNCYKNALEYFRTAEVISANNEITLASNALTRIENPKMQNILRHFLGLMGALNAKADNRTAKDVALAKELLSKTKGTLDTPEWHHFYAVLEYQDGHIEEFRKHIDIAKKLIYEREPEVKERIKDGLELDLDITKNMLSLCKDAENIHSLMFERR